MTTVLDVSAAAPVPAAVAPDHRGSWIPTASMITTRIMELRKRRGLMIALVVVNIGIPSLFLVIRLIAHGVAPKSYGAAGGYEIYTNLVAGVMYVFGFIVAATLGCTAGSIDLTEGMFRHLVVTGRSRLAIYLARIPAGLAIVIPLVAVGFTIVCAVCVFAAPTTLNYDGANVPANLSLSGFETWAANHPSETVGCLPSFNIQVANEPCQSNGPATIGGNGSGTRIVKGPPGAVIPPPPTAAVLKREAVQVARQDYSDYRRQFLYPSNSLMIKTGLWLELEATIGFILGLGLASLIGQRTVSVILIIVLELILTPVLSEHVIPHLINAQRGIVGLATAHLEPGGLPLPFSGGGGGGPNPGHSLLIPESATVAVCVIVGWIVVWTGLGAWRMMTRDA